MGISNSRITYLLNQFANNNCTKKELLELFEWIEKQKDEENLVEAMEAVWPEKDTEDQVSSIDKEKVFEKISSRVTPRKRNHGLFSQWRKVAAIFLLVCATVGSIYLINHKNSKKQIVAIDQPNDAPPGHSGAILTLSNGQKIILDSAGNGDLLKDGQVNIIKNEHGITYQGKTDEMVYNTISTANGRQWQLQLIDGTKVWLNAASSIRYPLNFLGNERKVEVSGEAYFEVVHNEKQPFRVHVITASGNESVIEDLGTAFNVNAYNDEPAVKTTLIEGEVKISTEQQDGVFLKPGQQAIVSGKKIPVKIDDRIDIVEITAWKDGLFRFNEGGVGAIMRQISRWYNVEVVYEGKVPNKQIHGTAPRNTNLSSIIKVLSLSGVHVRLEGNTIIVKD